MNDLLNNYNITHNNFSSYDCDNYDYDCDDYNNNKNDEDDNEYDSEYSSDYSLNNSMLKNNYFNSDESYNFIKWVSNELDITTICMIIIFGLLILFCICYLFCEGMYQRYSIYYNRRRNINNEYNSVNDIELV